ncbi:woronin body major protein [Paracoccidioides brasiliensis]|uniref:Woronin body major protein n=1 Tax=Paracoccidioides brasiliensis TaxID=121759 RepID=A0A1D2JCP7_PARBR|nr:woronin body major protein [Paracoccidioides brasiliensis]
MPDKITPVAGLGQGQGQLSGIRATEHSWINRRREWARISIHTGPRIEHCPSTMDSGWFEPEMKRTLCGSFFSGERIGLHFMGPGRGDEPLTYFDRKRQNCHTLSQFAFEKGHISTVNLDFDARVPIPFSVFPSSYRSDAVSETTHTRVEGEVKLTGASRVGREDTAYEGPFPSHSHQEVDVHIHSDRRQHDEFPRSRYPEVELTRERHYGNQDRKAWETQLDITEREYRQRTDPNYQVEYINPPNQVRDIDVSYNNQFQQIDTAGAPSHVSEVDYADQGSERASRDVNVNRRIVIEQSSPRKMGYYDDEGHYHSFRRGVERAADRILHPLHHHHDRKEEVVISDERGPTRVRDGVRESVRVVQPRGGHLPDTITIPCHFIRVGDLLILQGRPCQVIRISVSPQTDQHRYLGVDLFTRQLHEESSFISHPSSSVVVQSMLGPVYKTYRILDIREDGRIVAMTETGDVKQGLPVVDQGNLFNRISDAFSDGRGSIRALVINDGGRELVVDYKVIHGSRL